MYAAESDTEHKNTLLAYTALQPQEQHAELDELSMSDLDEANGGLMPLILFGYGYVMGRGIRAIMRDGI